MPTVPNPHRVRFSNGHLKSTSIVSNRESVVVTSRHTIEYTGHIGEKGKANELGHRNQGILDIPST